MVLLLKLLKLTLRNVFIFFLNNQNFGAGHKLTQFKILIKKGSESLYKSQKIIFTFSTDQLNFSFGYLFEFEVVVLVIS